MKIELPYNWQPRIYQQDVWNKMHSGYKRGVTKWHRRSGKDDLFLNFTSMASHERKGNYWYMLPEYAQARKSMWDAINPSTGIKRLDQAIPDAIRANVNQQEMKISLKCGSTFQLVGSDNFNSLVGSPPIGLVFSEYALSNPAAWAYLMPIVEENNGWAYFNSTPRGKNHFFKICAMSENREGWFYDEKTVNDTNVFSIEQLQNIREELIEQHGEAFGEAMYQQEYFVSFEAAVIGSIWADSIAKINALDQIREVNHIESLPVHVSYDIGKKDTTAMWFFQINGPDINVINFHESNHKDVPFYCDLLRKLSDEYGYKYATQWLPHDAFHDTLSNGGKTVIVQFKANNEDGKLGKFKRVPDVSKQDGIQAARATFPRCYFDEKKCEDGLEALKFYHHKYNEEKKVFTKEPVHDWASNAADSFRYLSLVWKEARQENVISIEDKLKQNSINAITMGSLTKQHLNRIKAARENY